MPFDCRQLLPDQLFNSLQYQNLTRIAEGERDARSSGSCCSTDAMDITFGIVRKFVMMTCEMPSSAQDSAGE